MRKFRNKRVFLPLMLVCCLVLMLSACGGGSSSGGGDTGGGATSSSGGGDSVATDIPASIKIGVPNPTTGGLAGFGVGTPWAELLVQKAVNDAGGIYIEEYDAYLPIECIFVDTESDSAKSGEVANQLITKDEVNIILARHTPIVAIPVSQAAENLQTPCISLDTPVNPWLAGGPYEWCFQSFWYSEDYCDLFLDMWDELGYGPGTKVGGIFPNDPTGVAPLEIFSEKLPARGYELVTPGLHEPFLADWSSYINMFKAEGVQIVTGDTITPDFATFTAQAVALGFDFEIASMGRAYLFPTDVEANPHEIIPRLTNEVWWSPWHPFTSSIDGMTCQELADMYEAEFNTVWSSPMGYKYASMELAVDALKRAASLDPVKIRDAIAATDLDTMIGHIKYDPDTHVSRTLIVGGQWIINDDGNAELTIVSNKSLPSVPLNGKLIIPER